MLLNIEKFQKYSDMFNILVDEFNSKSNKLIESQFLVEESELKNMIYNLFPHNWIIFGKYKVYTNDKLVVNYYKVCDLSVSSLLSLQTHINNIIAICDDSIQTLQDFDRFNINGL